MIIQCQSCSKKFIVKDSDIPDKGRVVQCGYCSVTWHQMRSIPEIKVLEKSSEVDDAPSIDSIKASDGKTYKFLGSQWAQILPSGKTGLFARKKISNELDEVTGRKEKKVVKKKKKIQEVNPSSENIADEKKFPHIYKPKNGMGFFGYIFLIIIISFFFVGILKTFENDLINYFPEIEYIFESINEQLNFLAESVKNMIVLISDLINDY